MAQIIVDWRPDKRSPVPLYLQIVQYMRDKITNGEWPVGSKIPTQRVLAREFDVNRSTVITALEELKAEGLLEAVEGSATRVSGLSWATLSTPMPPDWRSYVEAGIHQPNLPTIQEINRAEHDPGMIRLGTGELSPELLPVDLMEKILQRLPRKWMNLGYSEPKGLNALRQQVSNHLRSFGIEASPSSILIVSGALQALQLISLGVLRRGSTVFVEKPSYLYSLHVFQSNEMRLFGIPMDDQGICTDWIIRHKRAQNGALLYTIPSFHNPTGILMTEERRQQLMDVCEKERLPILEDDVYRELWLDAPVPAPLKARDKNGLVLYLGSMSKCVSPGLRIGWLVGPEPVIERLADVKMQTDYGSSALSQLAAMEWLESGFHREHMERVRAALRERRTVALQALESCFSDLASWNIPQGGFYIWLKLNRPLSMRQLFEKAREEGILLNPGYVYDRGADRHLRLSFSYAAPAELQSGIHRLSRLVRSLAQS
jgi:GntR family transcriptional regulator of abcA and norABC